MKYFLITLVILLTHTSSAKAAAKLTVEEEIVTRAFAALTIAGIYDKICNESQTQKADPMTSESVNFYGNMQMLAARMGGLWHVKNPQAPVDDGLKFLQTVQKKIEDSVEDKLQKSGCQSADGDEAKKAFTLITQTHPGVLYNILDKSITDKGGTITPPEQPATEKKD